LLTVESVSEKKLKIGEYLAKLQARTRLFRALSPSFSSALQAKRTKYTGVRFSSCAHCALNNPLSHPAGARVAVVDSAPACAAAAAVATSTVERASRSLIVAHHLTVCQRRITESVCHDHLHDDTYFDLRGSFYATHFQVETSGQNQQDGGETVRIHSVCSLDTAQFNINTHRPHVID